jgi:hypothetical protein
LHLSSGNNINCTTLLGFDGDILSKVLRGQPDIKQEQHPSKYGKSLPKTGKKMRSPPATKKKRTSEKHPAAESKAILSEKTDTELVKGARNKEQDLMGLYSLCNSLFSIPLLYPREL